MKRVFAYIITCCLTLPFVQAQQFKIPESDLGNIKSKKSASIPSRSYTLKSCLELGLENNYSIRIYKNEEQISKNNATRGNAG